MQKITLVREDQKAVEYHFYDLPDMCPYCNDGIVPIPVYGYFRNVTAPGLNRYSVQVVFECPKADCQALFVTQYIYTGDKFLKQRDLHKPTLTIKFDEPIREISPDFTVIYNQTFQAEQIGLSQITGPGYRKALEFLIKDYAIRSVTTQSEKDTILDSLLGKVIDNYIDDIRIKNTAKRATWLGNDETHYVRKWEDKDISDLKRLIDMTANWIILVELSNKFEEDMPEKKGKQ